MVKDQDGSLNVIFHALSDASRRTILRMLLDGERSIGELAPSFPMSFVAVSKHVKVLEQAGLLRRSKRGRHQICSVDPKGFKAARRWFDAYAEFWTGRLDALDGLIPEMKSQAAAKTVADKPRE